MGLFLKNEKLRQAQFKASSHYFSDAARLDGMYRGVARPFCLPGEYAEENLIPEIRESALAHFAQHSIKWHNGQYGKPSNHLCSSQVACVNFLFPFSDKPDLLAQLLSRVYPEINRMIPVENKLYVSFEWIGRENYLGEKISRNGLRHRGALFTSADAIVAFERKDKQCQVVLIEWKYGESYGGSFLRYAKSGTDRTGIYRHLLESPDCPINTDILLNFECLFYEPFYQFMRQQLLANEMQKANELNGDLVSVLHISPDHNNDFRKVTSPQLKGLGESATGIWKILMKNKERFNSVSTETLFGDLSSIKSAEISSWKEYIETRYAWIRTD